MKAKLGLIFLILQVSTLAFAATSGKKEFKFKYTYKGERLEIVETSDSWEKSFERSAMKCLKHFSKGQALSDDQGLDLVDLCANPKS